MVSVLKPPVPHDNRVGDPISRLLTVGSTPIWHSVLILNSNSVLNVKALVGAFYQEKALVGAFSVIVKTDCGTDGSVYSANPDAPIYSVQHTTSHTPLLPTWVGLFGNTK